MGLRAARSRLSFFTLVTFLFLIASAFLIQLGPARAAAQAPDPASAVYGDVNCDGAAAPTDALRLLRFGAGLPVAPVLGCADVGQFQGRLLWGDLDCNGDITSVDALGLLRYAAGLLVTQTSGCPVIGQVGPPLVIDTQEMHIIAADGTPGGQWTLPGDVTSTAWSPDSSRLAYKVYGNSSAPRLYIADAQGGLSGPFTAPPDWGIGEMIWAPDSSRLLYAANKSIFNANTFQVKLYSVDISGHQSQVPVQGLDAYPYFLSWQEGTDEILATAVNSLVDINISTGAVRTIYSADQEGTTVFGAASPDGSQVQLAVNGTSPACDGHPVSLILVDVASGQSRPLVQDVCGFPTAAWSPDGTRLAYAQLEGDKGVHIVDMASGAVSWVTHPEHFDPYVQWANDGALAVGSTPCYQCDFPGASWRYVPLDGSPGQDLADLAQYQAFGGFSPDGSHYLFSSDAVQVGQVGGAVTALTTADDTVGSINLSWSPDGTRIAFETTSNGAIRHYNVDLSAQTVERGYVPPMAFDIAYSPDQSLIAYREVKQNIAQLSVVDATGQNPRTLIDTSVLSYAWSPDGSRIAAVNGTGDLQSVDVQTGSPAPVAQLGEGYYTLAAWSPDGAYVSVINDSQQQLVLVNMANGQVIAAADGVQTSSVVSWSPDSNEVAFTFAGAKGTEVDIFDLGVMKIRPLTNSPFDSTPAWSPDGASIAIWRQVADYPDTPVVALINVNLESGAEQELARFFGHAGPLAWAGDSSILAQVATGGPGPGAGVYLVDVTGGGTRELVHEGSFRALTVHPSTQAGRFNVDTQYIGI